LPVYNLLRPRKRQLDGDVSIPDRQRPPLVTSVADNIVHMRALYGLDDGNNDATVLYNVTPTAGDGIVDRYVDAATFNALLALVPPARPTPWARLIAVRIALVSRSALPEKRLLGEAQRSVRCNHRRASVDRYPVGGLRRSITRRDSM